MQLKSLKRSRASSHSFPRNCGHTPTCTDTVSMMGIKHCKAMWGRCGLNVGQVQSNRSELAVWPQPHQRRERPVNNTESPTTSQPEQVQKTERTQELPRPLALAVCCLQTVIHAEAGTVGSETETTERKIKDYGSGPHT